VNDKTAHVADVCDMTMQLECFGEFLAVLAATLQHESDDGSVPTTAEVLLRALVPWAARQSGIVDALDL